MQNDSEVTAKVLEITQTYCEHVETAIWLSIHKAWHPLLSATSFSIKKAGADGSLFALVLT